MRIAVFGLGLIGSVWARHWHADGHQVRAWNRSPRPEQPGWTADPRAALRDAELAALVVSDAAAVRSLLGQLAPALAGCTVACHSTIGPADARAFAATCAAAGARYLDMPFTGSKPAAEQRQNVFFVGGEAADLARVEAVYAAVSKARLHLGGIGRASAVKLAMNLTIAGTFQALAEGLRIAERAGLGRQDFFRILDLNVAKSGLSELKRPKLLAGDYSPQFSVKHMHKDLRLALALAAELGQELPLTLEVERAYRRARERGLGEEDFAALVKTLA